MPQLRIIAILVGKHGETVRRDIDKGVAENKKPIPKKSRFTDREAFEGNGLRPEEHLPALKPPGRGKLPSRRRMA